MSANYIWEGHGFFVFVLKFGGFFYPVSLSTIFITTSSVVMKRQKLVDGINLVIMSEIHLKNELQYGVK